MNSVRCPVAGCRDASGVEPRELLAGAPVCEPCRGRARAALADLPLAYVELRGTGTGSAGTEYVSGTSVPGEPINVEHRVLATHIRNRLVSWEDTARGLRSLSPRPLRVREGWAVGHAVDLLEAHDDVLWSHPGYAADLAADLLRLRQRAWTVLGWNHAMRRHLAPPCPHCDRRALVREVGGGEGDHVRCLCCRARWDEPEYQRFVRIMAEQLGGLAVTG